MLEDKLKWRRVTPSNTEHVVGKRCVRKWKKIYLWLIPDQHGRTDGRVALFRVHLPGYYVISLVLFRSRVSSGVDSDCGYCWDCAVHFPDYLVSECDSASPEANVNSHLRRFCLRHPHVRDVCDIGQHLFWGSNIAWYLTAVMFLLNNTFIQVTRPISS